MNTFTAYRKGGTTHAVLGVGGVTIAPTLAGLYTLCGRQIVDASQWEERPDLEGKFGCANCLRAKARHDKKGTES